MVLVVLVVVGSHRWWLFDLLKPQRIAVLRVKRAHVAHETCVHVRVCACVYVSTQPRHGRWQNLRIRGTLHLWVKIKAKVGLLG